METKRIWVIGNQFGNQYCRTCEGGTIWSVRVNEYGWVAGTPRLVKCNVRWSDISKRVKENTEMVKW